MFFLLGIVGMLAVGSLVALPLRGDVEGEEDQSETVDAPEEDVGDEETGDLLMELGLLKVIEDDVTTDGDAASSEDFSQPDAPEGEVHGTDESDVLDGDPQADTIFGHDGNDSLVGHGGDDILAGGADDDFLSGGTGRDALHGQDGNDTIFGGAGQDTLLGGRGDDFLQGANSDDGQLDYLNGGDGNDTLMLGGGDIAFGGQGEDAFIVSEHGSEPIELLDFDQSEDQIIILHSGGETDEEPEVEVRLSESDPDLAEILVNGKVVVILPASDAPTADQISILAEG